MNSNVNRKNKKIGLVFFALLAVAAAVTWFAMPRADVQAYRNDGSHKTNKNVIPVNVKVVNEDGDSITDAKLKISSIRYLEDGTEKDEGTSIQTLGTTTLSNDYVDQFSTDGSGTTYGEFFSYEKENMALFTIEEDTPPDGYTSLPGKIVLDYHYENPNPDGLTIFPEGTELTDHVVYNLEFDFVNNENAGGQAKITTDRGYHDSVEAYNLIITYKTEKPTGNLTINKVLSGTDTDPNKEFTFNVTLKDSNDAALANKTFGDITTSESGVATLKLKGSDSATIPGLPDGTKYSIEEADYSNDGYNAASWKDGNGAAITGNPGGTIAGAIPASNVSYTATNTKYTPASVTTAPQVTKVLDTTGGTPTGAEPFVFVLLPVSNTAGIATNDMPLPAQQVTSSNPLPVITILGPGSRAFEDITFSKAGTYVYSIEEMAGSTEGYTYDDQKYTLTYTVTLDGANKKLVVSDPAIKDKDGADATSCTFTNKYTTPPPPTPYIDAPEVTKVLTGETPDEDETFKFKLTPDSNTAGIDVSSMPMPTPEGGTTTSNETSVTGEGDGSFADITFTKEGEYIYKVTETPGNTTGYTYDDQEYTLKYTVTYLADTNTYTATKEITNKSGTTVDKCTFTNTYTKPEDPEPDPEPDPEYTPAEVSLPLEKEITGDEIEEDTTFAFTMKTFSINGDDPTPDMPMPDGADNGQLKLDMEIPAGENLGEGNFGDITFTEPGEYVYEISEEDSGSEGFTYDTSKYRVMWKVTTGVDDVLEADMTIADENGTIVDEGLIKFTNTFEKEEPTPDPEPVDLEPVSVTPSFEKVVTGAKPDAPASFKFIFTALRNDADINVADMPMPGGAKGPETSLEVKGPGSYEFGNIEFTTPGEYTYTLQEEVGKEKGYAYDSETFYFTWTVTEKDGALDAQLEIKDSNEAPCEESVFSNRYTSPTSTNMTVEKTVKGDTPDAAGKFEFTLKPVSNNAGFEVSEMPMPAGTQNGVAKINAEGPGSYNFGDLTFTRRGDYTYEVREVNTYEKGYTYDDEVYTVTWSIARDEGTSFTAKSTIKNSAGEEVKSLAFANTYAKDAPVNPTPEPVIIDPPLQKLVTGDEPMDPGSFTFVMRAESNTAGYEVADMPMPEGAKDGVAKHTVEGPGSYEFGEYTITKPGHYVYSLNEENVGEEGYTYDTTRYTIFWNITEVDGKLVAEKTIADQDGKLVESASFTNNYSYDKSPLDPDDNDDNVIDETQKVKKTPVKTKAAKTGDLSALTYAYALLIASLLAGIALRRRTN